MAKKNPGSAVAWWALGTLGGSLLGAYAVYHLGPGAKERRELEKRREAEGGQGPPQGAVGAAPVANPYPGQIIPPPPPAPLPFPYPVPVGAGFGQQQQQAEQHHHYYGSMPAMPAMPPMPGMEPEPNPEDEVEPERRDPVEDIIGDWDAHGYED